MKSIGEITIKKILSIGNVNLTKNQTNKMENRFCYGLSFCREGQITYSQNGEDYISNNDYAIILPEGGTYSLRCDKKGVFPVVNFKANDFLCDTIMQIPLQNCESFIMEFDKMCQLSLFDGNSAKIMSIFYDILHRLSKQNESRSIITPAVVYIENNFDDCNITNSFLASMCHISEVYFRKTFLKEFGVTPKHYLIEIRINKACQLLSEDKIKISAVSEKCGFTNQYHFSRIFKTKTGFTPNEFRKQSDNTI